MLLVKDLSKNKPYSNSDRYVAFEKEGALL